MDRLPPLDWLRTFEVSARHLSFTRAALELHLTQSAVSQQIRSLESYFGQKLFHRLTRGLALTEAGKALHPGVHYAVDSLARASRVLIGSASREAVAISSTISFASLCLAPRLRSFQQANPEIEIQIDTAVWADPNVPVPDFAVRVGDGQWPGMHAEKLLSEEMIAVCAPSILQRGKTRDLLSENRLIHIKGERLGWHDWFAEEGRSLRRDHLGIWVNNSLLALELARSGCGVALVRSIFATHHLQLEQLVIPFNRRLNLVDSHYLLSSDSFLPGGKRDKLWRWLKEEFGDLPKHENLIQSN